MPVRHSRITSQGQVSVPAAVRQRLGVGPGAVLEWEEHGDGFVVRRAGRSSTAEIHAALFGTGPPPRGKLPDIKAGIRAYVRRRHARS
ncbi:MAG: AbrB/MazE/SpoVT family DNA-binding domain-containing protein [Gammaproteobacteria bacterium]|nr:AbrB/MazE/SpoVT family DNA-binding domain-containing protein [Gammaproteobacteria bacterium]